MAKIKDSSGIKSICIEKIDMNKVKLIMSLIISKFRTRLITL